MVQHVHRTYKLTMNSVSSFTANTAFDKPAENQQHFIWRSTCSKAGDVSCA